MRIRRPAALRLALGNRDRLSNVRLDRCGDDGCADGFPRLLLELWMDRSVHRCCDFRGNHRIGRRDAYHGDGFGVDRQREFVAGADRPAHRERIDLGHARLRRGKYIFGHRSPPIFACASY